MDVSPLNLYPMDVIHSSQVGSSGIRTLSTTSAPLSMGQILEVLLGKAKAEAEEAQVRKRTGIGVRQQHVHDSPEIA